MVGIKSFKELEVYQKAYRVSLDIHKASLNFPKIEQYSLADQIRRASKSICSNIAEGFGKQRGSKAGFRRFLLMALGSSNEVTVWIDYCTDMAYIDKQTSIHWNNDTKSSPKCSMRLSAK